MRRALARFDSIDIFVVTYTALVISALGLWLLWSVIDWSWTAGVRDRLGSYWMLVWSLVVIGINIVIGVLHQRRRARREAAAARAQQLAAEEAGTQRLLNLVRMSGGDGARPMMFYIRIGGGPDSIILEALDPR